MRTWLSILAVGLLSVIVLPLSAQTQSVDALLPGDDFPPATYRNLNAAAGGPPSIDLAASLGQRPVVLLYWVPGHARADKMLQQLQQLADSVPADRAVFYGVAIRRQGRAEAEITKSLGELGIKLPVLDDAKFTIGQQLRVQTVPNASIIDKSGKLRLANGASMSQVIGYEQTVESAIKRAATSGEVGNYGYLDVYYPVNELVGKPCPDFKAPLLSTSVEQRWSGMIKDDHVNILIFWSVNCPHCRRELPAINAWLRQNQEGFNVVSAAGIEDDVTKTRTKEFCDLNKFVFPTLVDRDLQISTLFQVTSTPTILFIGPNGVIDSVVLSSTQNFGQVAAQKKRDLLGS